MHYSGWAIGRMSSRADQRYPFFTLTQGQNKVHVGSSGEEDVNRDLTELLIDNVR